MNAVTVAAHLLLLITYVLGMQLLAMFLTLTISQGHCRQGCPCDCLETCERVRAVSGFRGSLRSTLDDEREAGRVESFLAGWVEGKKKADLALTRSAEGPCQKSLFPSIFFSGKRVSLGVGKPACLSIRNAIRVRMLPSNPDNS